MSLPSVPTPAPTQPLLYEDAVSEFGAALVRLARSYEADRDKQQDLLQEIHLALWRSLEGFDGRCSLRTWVYRVAHNVATTHVISRRRSRTNQFVSLEDVEIAGGIDVEHAVDRALMLDRLSALIQQLAPIDRQIMVLYLEGTDAASIGEITGVSAGNVATKISRIKTVLSRRVRQGDHDGE